MPYSINIIVAVFLEYLVNAHVTTFAMFTAILVIGWFRKWICKIFE
jgi:hypothetical protein